jgi:hypothetical protein
MSRMRNGLIKPGDQLDHAGPAERLNALKAEERQRLFGFARPASPSP